MANRPIIQGKTGWSACSNPSDARVRVARLPVTIGELTTVTWLVKAPSPNP